jgi:hypothetical protein
MRGREREGGRGGEGERGEGRGERGRGERGRGEGNHVHWHSISSST